VYGWDTLVLLKHLLDEGLKKTAIAERLGISRRLVYHLIETGQLDRDLSEPPPRRTRTPAPPKLEPYKPIITARLETYPELSAVRLFDECRAAGYAGGGVPAELLFDQMKAVIIEDQRAGGGKLLENPEFLRFAAHWSFRIRACRPYRAKTKGKVERPVAYVRDNLVYGREFLGDGDLDAERLRWLDGTANVRIHGTTKEQPQLRFERDERALLQALAVHPYRSLVLSPERDDHATLYRAAVRATDVHVERRTLSTYSTMVEEVA
jgi:transposase